MYTICCSVQVSGIPSSGTDTWHHANLVDVNMSFTLVLFELWFKTFYITFPLWLLWCFSFIHLLRTYARKHVFINLIFFFNKLFKLIDLNYAAAYAACSGKQITAVKNSRFFLLLIKTRVNFFFFLIKRRHFCFLPRNFLITILIFF